MKKKNVAMVGLAVAAGCALSMGAASTALAATNVNNIKASGGAAVYKVDPVKGGSFNLDNQGGKEKISFAYTKNKEVKDAYTDMTMTVEGKTVTVIKDAYFYEPKVTFMRTANGTGFINILAYGENDYIKVSKAYRYHDGAIESEAMVNPLAQFSTFEEYGYHYGAVISGVKGDNFTVNISTQFAASGMTSFKYELFKTAESESDTYEPVKSAVKASSWFSKAGSKGAKHVTWSPTVKRVQLYKDANTTKKSTTMAKGTKAKVIGVNITPFDVPTIKIQTKSGTKGWIKCSKSYSKGQVFKYATFAG